MTFDVLRFDWKGHISLGYGEIGLNTKGLITGIWDNMSVHFENLFPLL